MRAMALVRPGPLASRPLEARDVPVPSPGPGEILVKVAACGVCRTDLHEVLGEVAPPRLPVVPGHQVVGRVAALGTGAGRFRAGDRVGVAWLHRACGACAFCATGRENLCPDALFTGLDRDGGWAEFCAVPEAFAYALPAGADDAAAAPLLCAGVIGYRALRLAGCGPVAGGGPRRVGLWGFGASAHVAIQVLRHWGAEVAVFTRSERHAAHARDLGAAWTGRPGDDPGDAVEAGVVFAPAGDVVPLALERLAPGAALALAGIEMSAIPPLAYRRHLYRERVLRSVANATRRDAEDLLALAAAIPIRTDVVTYPLDRALDALGDLEASRLRGAAVLVP